MECDVLIIGAGPAGLISGLILSKSNYSICILEEKENILSDNKKYDITEDRNIKNILDEIGVCANKKSNFSEWISPNYNFLLESKIKDLYFKRRSDKDSLENKLLDKINFDKTNIFYKSKITNIQLKNNKINSVDLISNRKRYTIFPKSVIIADGSDSTTIKRLGIKHKINAEFFGYGLVIKTQKVDLIPHAKIFFNTNLAPGGYLYMGSCEKETFFCIVIDKKVGKSELMKKNLEKFVNENFSQNFKKINSFTGFGISGEVNNKICNTYIIGGAAFLNDPFLGYGLNFAIESAYYASKAIIDKNPSIYNNYLKEIQKNFEDMFFVREIWRNTNNDFFDELIKSFKSQKIPENKDIQRIISLFEE